MLRAPPGPADRERRQLRFGRAAGGFIAGGLILVAQDVVKDETESWLNAASCGPGGLPSGAMGGTLPHALNMECLAGADDGAIHPARW
jgi:hypothetical protein